MLKNYVISLVAIILCANANYEEVYKNIVAQPAENIENLGPVYLLTLVSFITRGKAPIYDIFALRAIAAIKHEIPLGASVPVGGLIQNKKKTEVSKVLSLYNEYIDNIEDVFGTEYQNNRNIDRALWVYGHLFK